MFAASNYALDGMQPNQFLKNRCGIYGIYNPHIGKIYVGKTIDFFRRCAQYKYDFDQQRGDHLNPYLLAAMNKHGFDSFVFFPLEFCEESELSIREEHWMTFLKSTERSRGYNLRSDSSGGMRAHADTVEKIRANLKRQWAAGIRDGHSEKLKANWATNKGRVKRQGALFSRYLTKYVYVVKPPRGRNTTVKYKRLCELGLQGVISKMHKNKSNDVVFKGYRVVKRLIEDDEL